MAHFAKLDDNNIVLEIQIVSNESLDPQNEEASGIEFLTAWSGGYTNWKQCSYNATKRVRYPAVGDIYDVEDDAFYAPKPTEYPSWILNKNSGVWEPPKSIPNMNEPYWWNEETQEWQSLLEKENN